MKCKLSAILLLTVLPVSTLLSQAQQDANPVDLNAVFKTLQEIKHKQQDSAKTTQIKYAQQFMGLAGSTSAALGAYRDAIRATKLDGKSQESLDYQEWEKASAERFKSRAFRDGLSFHLSYLALTLRHSAGVETKVLVPDLINYTQQVLADYDQLGGRPVSSPSTSGRQGGRRGNQQNANAIINTKTTAPALDPEFMNQPVNVSVFVKWLGLTAYVTGGDDWEMAPGNVDGMYDKTILPEFRKNKDPRLLQYWDQRIQREGGAAGKSGLNFDADQFDQVTKPRLMWKRSQELIVLGQKNRAINEMLGLIKGYPSHPDFGDWVSQLEDIVKPAAPAQTAAPVSAAPSTPPQG